MGAEGPREDPISPPGPETSEPSRGMTRREFLKGLGAAALYPSALLAGEKDVPSKEAERSAAERSRIYKKGLIELRLEARMNPKEQQRLFIDSGAQSTWIPLEEGGRTASFTPFGPIEEALRDKQAKIRDFHTHPSKLIPQGLTMPPSLQDFMSLPEMRKNFKEDMDRLSFATVDEQGSWAYDLDWENPTLKEALAFNRQSEERNAVIETDPEVKSFFASQTGGDVRLSAMDLVSRENEFGPAARAAIEGLKETSNEAENLPFYKEAMRLDIEQACVPMEPEKIRERIEALRKIGVIVSFTPFEKGK